MSRRASHSEGVFPTTSRFFYSIMYLCYIDESGTSSIPGNTSHFVLAGLAIPIWHWKVCERDIINVKARYGLQDSEIHTAWILRNYTEQNKIPNFASLSHYQRRYQV